MVLVWWSSRFEIQRPSNLIYASVGGAVLLVCWAGRFTLFLVGLFS